jgi:tRNA(Arg) A34 adenosine deaminase TadA
MDDRKYLEQAKLLAESSDEPVKCACVLVSGDGNIVASAFNSQRTDGLVASHAEMKAIALANSKLGRKLNGITAYGNCEPCTMCLTALIFAGVDRIVFTHRLNDFVSDDKKIEIDCFDFVTRFPNPPLIEQVQT